MSGNGEGRVLVQTVGTGSIDDLENTLIKPMVKSIQDGDWRHIVLLPSKGSEALARLLPKRLPDETADICILPLPKVGAENDADACFDHFDKVLGELVESGIVRDQIVPDFTRGTKAMSAALVLAAVRRDIPTLRYVHSDYRDRRGMAVPGTETVGGFRTIRVSARRRLDDAVELMANGAFGAAQELIRNGQLAERWPVDLRGEAEGLCASASLFAAWDRLDYRRASEFLVRHTDTFAKAPTEFRPSDCMRAFLRRLAVQPKRALMERYASWLRAIACDLLANAERRVQHRQYEDALIRSYRVLEMVGQFRLFDRGIDSSSIDPNNVHVKKLSHKLQRKNSSNFGCDPKTGNLTAPRNVVARLLVQLGDPLGRQLINFDRKGSTIAASARNHSILVHGFEARATSGRELGALLEEIQELLLSDDVAAMQRLETARRLNFRSGH